MLSLRYIAFFEISILALGHAGTSTYMLWLHRLRLTLDMYRAFALHIQLASQVLHQPPGAVYFTSHKACGRACQQQCTLKSDDVC